MTSLKLTDALLLNDLRVTCIIGDLPHERTTPQELSLDMEIYCDTRLAATTDALHDTINYVSVIDAVRQALIATQCKMIERAAQVAIDAAFATDERITAITITLRKPHAIEGVIAGIRIHRQR